MTQLITLEDTTFVVAHITAWRVETDTYLPTRREPLTHTRTCVWLTSLPSAVSVPGDHDDTLRNAVGGAP